LLLFVVRAGSRREANAFCCGARDGDADGASTPSTLLAAAAAAKQARMALLPVKKDHAKASGLSPPAKTTSTWGKTRGEAALCVGANSRRGGRRAQTALDRPARAGPRPTLATPFAHEELRDAS
jgi:hypothetical protein